MKLIMLHIAWRGGPRSQRVPGRKPTDHFDRAWETPRLRWQGALLRQARRPHPDTHATTMAISARAMVFVLAVLATVVLATTVVAEVEKSSVLVSEVPSRLHPRRM